jgi:molybdate transport system substrate-binding protein
MVSCSRLAAVLVLVFSPWLQAVALAAEIHVAVASNFLLPMQAIAARYEQHSGDRLIISAGSTGKLYAQIVNGAPYDVFLAANSREPERLEQQAYAEAHSRFTYARGQLALWDPRGRYAQTTLKDVLMNAPYQRLSLANPLTAPYGAAAMDVLKTFQLDKNDRTKILRGENVSQAFQYLASGAADLGFVALAQIRTLADNKLGHVWVVDESMHAPILQQAVLLASSKHRDQARAFLDYLKSDQGRAMIESFGYGSL